MESVIRPALVYLFLLVLLRLTGKRTLAQITSFDFVLLLIISEATQQALIGEDNSMINSRDRRRDADRPQHPDVAAEAALEVVRPAARRHPAGDRRRRQAAQGPHGQGAGRRGRRAGRRARELRAGAHGADPSRDPGARRPDLDHSARRAALPQKKALRREGEWGLGKRRISRVRAQPVRLGAVAADALRSPAGSACRSPA